MRRRSRWEMEKFKNRNRESEERWRKLKEIAPPYAPELPRDPYSSPHKVPVWGVPVADYEEYDGN